MLEMDKIVSLAKRRGFIYPASEIYGGFAGFWDYGPLGVELKNNIKKEWWHTMVNLREDIVGLDGAVIMNPEVWEKSGHVSSFTDPLVECKKCHHRFRPDKIKSDRCPDCNGEFTDPKTLPVELVLAPIIKERPSSFSANFIASFFIFSSL